MGKGSVIFLYHIYFFYFFISRSCESELHDLIHPKMLQEHILSKDTSLCEEIRSIHNYKKHCVLSPKAVHSYEPIVNNLQINSLKVTLTKTVCIVGIIAKP